MAEINIPDVMKEVDSDDAQINRNFFKLTNVLFISLSAFTLIYIYLVDVICYTKLKQYICL